IVSHIGRGYGAAPQAWHERPALGLRHAHEAGGRHVHFGHHVEHGRPMYRLGEHSSVLERSPIGTMRAEAVCLVLESCHQHTHFLVLHSLSRCRPLLEPSPPRGKHLMLRRAPARLMAVLAARAAKCPISSMLCLVMAIG